MINLKLIKHNYMVKKINKAFNSLFKIKDDHAFFISSISILIASGIYFRIIAMTGIIGSDDIRYIEFSKYFIDFEPFTKIDHAAGRLLFMFLIGLPIKLGGHAIYAVYANIFYSLIIDLIVVIFCFKRFGKEISLIAATILAFSPLNIIFTGAVLPDVTNTLFMLIAVLLIFLSIETSKYTNRFIYYGIAGIAAAFSYMCKDPGIFLLPVISTYLFIWPKNNNIKERLLGPITFILSFGAMLILDGLIFYLYTGDFFYKATATQMGHNAGKTTYDLIEFMLFNFKTLIKAVKDYEVLLIPVVLGIPSMILSFIFNKKYRIFTGFGLFSVLFLIFGTSSFSHLIPLPYQIRYFQPIIPFATIAIVALLSLWVPIKKPVVTISITFLIILILVIPSYKIVLNQSGRMYQAHWYRSISNAIEILQNENKKIFIAPRTLYFLKYFTFDQYYKNIHEISTNEKLEDGYYIMHPNKKYQFLNKKQSSTINQLPVHLKVAIDWSLYNKFKVGKPLYVTSPAVFVHEKTSNERTDTRTDLELYYFNCQKNGNRYSCNIGVRNNSKYWAGTSIIEISRIDNNNQKVIIHQREIEGLRGIDKLVYTEKDLIFNPEYSISVCVLPKHKILERNERNNCKQWIQKK